MAQVTAINIIVVVKAFRTARQKVNESFFLLFNIEKIEYLIDYNQLNKRKFRFRLFDFIIQGLLLKFSDTATLMLIQI